MERSGEKFFLRVIAGYDELAKREPHRIKIIDASGNINDTHKQILSHIQQKNSQNLIFIKYGLHIFFIRRIFIIF